MDVKFKINKNRRVNCSRYHIGTVGENNVTTFLFEYPEELQDFSLSLTISNSNGSFPIPVLNDTATLPSYALTDEVFYAQAIFTKPNGDIWKSDKVKFMLYNSLDDSGVNIFDAVKSEQREADRHELGGAITNITGNDYSGSEWDELISEINGFSLLNEENLKKIENSEHISFLFERSSNPPSLLYSNYVIGVDDYGNGYVGEDDLITLPYLYTPNAKYQTGNGFILNSYIRNLEIDVSGVDDKFNTSTYNTSRTYWLRNTNIDTIVLTGAQNINNMAFLFAGSQVTSISLYETGAKRDDVTYINNWEATFKDCINLQYIYGCIDPARNGGTFNIQTFMNCPQLRYISIKPRSIKTYGHFGGCYSLTHNNMEAIIQILNGCRDWVNSETSECNVTFNLSIQRDFENNKCYCNRDTGEFISQNSYNMLSEDDKKLYGSGIDYVNAFTHQGEATSMDHYWYTGKGVSLHWS